MNRIVYVNGELVAEAEAKISVFDRGFLFADAVYEVSSVLQGKLVDNNGHMVRLKRSLGELDMQAPASAKEIEDIQKILIEKNGIEEGLVYIQVTRGAADRDFYYPINTPPSLVMFTQKKNLIDSPQAKAGIAVITVPDIRWQRRDIKTTALLAASMAKMQARAAGADDAWLLQDGFITEGSASNALIVTQQGSIVTRHLGSEILAGITRKATLRLAKKEGIQIQERPFSLEEALAASEAFVTSATTFVTPVVSINGKKIGKGTPGSIAMQLRELYIEEAYKAQ